MVLALMLRMNWIVTASRASSSGEARAQHDPVHDRVRVAEVVLVSEGGLQQVGG